MVLLRHKLLPRYLLLCFVLALLLFISSFWLRLMLTLTVILCEDLHRVRHSDLQKFLHPCNNTTLRENFQTAALPGGHAPPFTPKRHLKEFQDQLIFNDWVLALPATALPAPSDLPSLADQLSKSPLPEAWLEPGGGSALIKECPGQSFQAWRLLKYLKSSMADDGDILLESYLQGWDQLLEFMDSLGTMVSFFSQKVREKTSLIRELSLRHSLDVQGKTSNGPTPPAFGLKDGAYRSVQSMVKAELNAGVVNFYHRTDSGCRTLLRLHRSLLWLKLMLEGLSEGPDADGQYKTPGELSRDAYMVALAPHHLWLLRQAAEVVFLALPDRQYFLQLVCVQKQEEATPVLRIIIHALTQVHTRTQQILEEHGMLELP